MKSEHCQHRYRPRFQSPTLSAALKLHKLEGHFPCPQTVSSPPRELSCCHSHQVKRVRRQEMTNSSQPLERSLLKQKAGQRAPIIPVLDNFDQRLVSVYRWKKKSPSIPFCEIFGRMSHLVPDSSEDKRKTRPDTCLTQSSETSDRDDKRHTGWSVWKDLRFQSHTRSSLTATSHYGSKQAHSKEENKRQRKVSLSGQGQEGPQVWQLWPGPKHSFWDATLKRNALLLRNYSFSYSPMQISQACLWFALIR